MHRLALSAELAAPGTLEVELALRGWLVVDAAVDAIGWDQRSLTAIVGLSIAPVRLWGHS
jgi:hypothetical protein